MKRASSIMGPNDQIEESEDIIEDDSNLLDLETQETTGEGGHNLYFNKQNFGKYHVFYEEHIEDERYNTQMIEELFVKKKTKFNRRSKRFGH